MTIPAAQVERERLLKDFRPEPKRPGVWNFSSPQNLYLTDQQGKLYLEAMADERYSAQFHDKAEALMRSNARRIVERIEGDSVFIADLGPGFPGKTLPLIDALRERGTKIEYWAVDVNEYFCNLARDAVAARGVRRASAQRMLFEDVPARIEASKIACPKIVVIGLTFMNFEADAMLDILAGCAGGERDLCLSAVESADGLDAGSMTAPYRSEACEAFLFAPLSLLGLRKDDVEYLVEFSGQRVEMAFVLKSVPADLDRIGVKPGDRIINAVSYRYTAAQYEALLASRFSRNAFYRLDNTIVGLSKGGA